MPDNGYRFKFYLNAVHSIEINSIMGQEHPHTWEIGIDTFKFKESFIMFSDIEKKIESFLAIYQDKNLNTLYPFNSINPTLENLAFFFTTRLEKILVENGWVLRKLEISETPTRTFIIDISNSFNTMTENNEHNTSSSIASFSELIEKNIDETILKKMPLIDMGLDYANIDEEYIDDYEKAYEFIKQQRKLLRKRRRGRIRKRMIRKYILITFSCLLFIIALLYMIWRYPEYFFM